MKISFVTLSLSIVSGFITLLLLTKIPTQTILIALSLIAFILLSLSFYLNNRSARLVLLFSIFLFSFCYGCLRADLALEKRLPLTAEGHYYLIATIDSIPRNAPGYSSADVTVEHLTPALAINPEHLHLNWYSPYPKAAAPWRAGETWQFTVKLKSLRSTYNPASFDYEAWALVHGSDGAGSVSDVTTAKRLKASPHWQLWLNAMRARLNTRIWASCGQYAGCAQVQALTLGQRDTFSHQDWQLLQATGTNHLFAIAGLHIGFVAAACFWLGLNGWRFVPKGPLWITAPTVGWLLALLGAAGYSALAGFLLPTKRACLTLAVILIARLLHRRLPPWHAWSLALTAVLLWQPVWVLDNSLWLSFGTVALLIYAYAYRWPTAHHGWRNFFTLQAVLSLGLWPLTAFFFGNISLSSYIANLLAIPWVAITTLPLCLLGVLVVPFSTAMASTCWRIASFNVNLLKHGLTWLSHLPYSHLNFSFNNPSIVLLATIGVLLLLAPQAVPGRWLGIIYCLAALLWPHLQPKPHSVWLTLLDVGQGLSVLLQTEHHALVFDTGSRFSDQSDMGERVVLPALKAAGLMKLDALIISHGDNDHAGGAASVWAGIATLNAYTSDLVKLNKIAAAAPWQACVAGNHWQWDGIDFTFLYPPVDDPRSGNDRSCVLKISLADQQLLLTGDIEKFSEHYLVSEHAPLESTLIVVPHHGSKTSSTVDFLAWVKPKIALFPVGYHNRFHFPNPLVVKRYQALPAQLYDTATHGQIRVILVPGQAPQVITTRQVHPPFWRIP